jgi:hypothetical protein
VGSRAYLFAGVSKGQGQGALPSVGLYDGGSAVATGVGMIIEGLLQIAGVGIYESGKGNGFGVIWEIGSDPRSPSLRMISQKGVPISNRYSNLITFEQGGKAYVLGVHEKDFANIWCVNDDPSSGFTLVYYGKNPSDWQKVKSD